jgi:hypothetical protein
MSFRFRPNFGRSASLVTGPKLAVRLPCAINRNGRDFRLAMGWPD